MAEGTGGTPSLKLSILTIVLDGEPFIEQHLPIFQKLNCDWHWHIAEGAAKNTHCTAWCQKQKPRLSQDGTSEYLDSIDYDRVTLHRKKLWDGKLEMFNTMLAQIREPCVLMQIDSDEIWQTAQLDKIIALFSERPSLDNILFRCRYFVGERLILRGENCYGDHPYEWLRAWRYTPGRTFAAHEPPVLGGASAVNVMSKTESQQLIGTFDHFAYATESQCAFKEKFYGYRGLVTQWRALQRYFSKSPLENRESKIPLSRFFPHVKGDLPTVEKISY